MPGLSSADHSTSPPAMAITRDYNAAHDLIERNLAQRVNPVANALVDLGAIRPAAARI